MVFHPFSPLLKNHPPFLLTSGFFFLINKRPPLVPGPSLSERWFFFSRFDCFELPSAPVPFTSVPHAFFFRSFFRRPKHLPLDVRCGLVPSGACYGCPCPMCATRVIFHFLFACFCLVIPPFITPLVLSSHKKTRFWLI